MDSDRRAARKKRRAIMMRQKLMGFALLVICLIVFVVCGSGENIIDQDASGAVLVLPLALYLIFTKKICIYC